MYVVTIVIYTSIIISNFNIDHIKQTHCRITLRLLFYVGIRFFSIRTYKKIILVVKLYYVRFVDEEETQ